MGLGLLDLIINCKKLRKRVIKWVVIPVVSITTQSNVANNSLVNIWWNVSIRSCRTLQHMHPLFISIIFSLTVCCINNSWSTPSLPYKRVNKQVNATMYVSIPISFSMTNILIPIVLCNIFWINVVLPLPSDETSDNKWMIKRMND